MALTASWPTQSATGNPIADTRKVAAAKYVANAAGQPRLGLLPVHQNPIVTALASMNFAVAPFGAIASRTGVGVEEVANDATTNVATIAAPASNSRIDVIWFRPQFVASGDANNNVVFGVTNGVAAGSPTKPAIPAGALELATAVIPSTATATNSAGVVITQTFLFTAMAGGGPVWVRNDTELNAWTPADGNYAIQLQADWLYERVGGIWLPIASPWNNYSPTWVSTGTQPVLNNGTLTARWRYIAARTIEIRWNLVWGSTTAGGTGSYSFSLPPGLNGVAAEQIIMAKCYTEGPYNWEGYGLVSPSGTTVVPFFPSGSGDNRMNAVSSSASGAVGTGVPAVAAAYTFNSAGKNIVVQGTLELS